MILDLAQWKITVSSYPQFAPSPGYPVFSKGILVQISVLNRVWKVRPLVAHPTPSCSYYDLDIGIALTACVFYS